MIRLLLQTYAHLLTTIGIAAILCLMIGSYLIVRLFSQSNRDHRPDLTQPMAQPVSANSKTKTLTAKQLLQDLTAIAGEDILMTQLDLAQAYIDSGKKDLAKNILNNVLAQGSAAYKQEAKQLLNCM